MDDACLIVGLGNPGEKYAMTRHNIGFMCLQHLANAWNIHGTGDTKFNAIIGKGSVHGKKVVLAEPLTFMNRSGDAVSRIQQFYKMPTSQILIIYDDIDLPFGTIRYRHKGSAGSHNGMKSLVQMLGTQEFPRLRMGINPPPPQWDLVDYVLSRFSDDEMDNMSKIMKGCRDAVELWLTQGGDVVMNRFNNTVLIPKPAPEKPAETPSP